MRNTRVRFIGLLLFVFVGVWSTQASATSARLQLGLGGGVALLDDSDRTDDDLDAAFGYDLQIAGMLGLTRTIFLGGYFNYMGGTHHPEANNDLDITFGLVSFGPMMRIELSSVFVDLHLGYVFGDAEFELPPIPVIEIGYGGFQFGAGVYFPIKMGSSATLDLGPYFMANTLSDTEENLDSDVTYVQIGAMAKLTFGTLF